MKICLELWSAHDAGLIRFLQQPRHPLLILQRFDWTRVAQCHAEVASTFRNHLYSSQFIYRYILMGREKMATAGSRHVMESYREINDRLPVVPEAMMEIGHTHIYLLTTDAHVRRRDRRGGCQEGEWCMSRWVFLTSLSSQGKQGHAAWLLTDTWIWVGLAGWLLLLGLMRTLYVCVCLCETKHHHLDHSSPQAFPKDTQQRSQ